uniref:Uncharacterized protein n=1 Tax=Oryza punctata TaxID=4537 RepID=A0A0E0ME55_ORYPU
MVLTGRKIERSYLSRQKRQADNRYRRSMHLRMTPWIEAWSQALNDVVHETRAYDHNTYKQYMALYSSQTRIRLLAPEDPDERGELVREAKTLWEKFRDGIAGTNQEVMAAVDSLRRKANHAACVMLTFLGRLYYGNIKKDVRPNAGASIHLFPAFHLSPPFSLRATIH